MRASLAQALDDARRRARAADRERRGRALGEIDARRRSPARGGAGTRPRDRARGAAPPAVPPPRGGARHRLRTSSTRSVVRCAGDRRPASSALARPARRPAARGCRAVARRGRRRARDRPGRRREAGRGARGPRPSGCAAPTTRSVPSVLAHGVVAVADHTARAADAREEDRRLAAGAAQPIARFARWRCKP